MQLLTDGEEYAQIYGVEMHLVGSWLVHQLVRRTTDGIQVNLQKKASKVMTFGQEKSLKIDDFWRRIKTSFIVWKAAAEVSE